jgi:hypothetical protein
VRERDLGELGRERRLDVGELDVGDDLARSWFANWNQMRSAPVPDAICPGNGSHSRHAATSA